MVKSLGKGEAESILAERGRIEVRCEFCGSNYLFDKVDIEEMFADPAFKGQTSQTTH